MKLNFIVATDGPEDLSHIILRTIYADHVPSVGSWVRLFDDDYPFNLPDDWMGVAGTEFDSFVCIQPSAVVDHIEYDYPVASNEIFDWPDPSEITVNIFVDVVEVEK